MGKLYVSSTGSDSPAGATAALKLAVVATPAGAMKTLSALAALLNSYYVATGTVYCTGSTEIVISGIIYGTTSAPDAAYCYFNGSVCGSPACFRQWEDKDGTPPSGPILPWGADGGVPVNPTWTYGAPVATAWGSSALPAGMTAAKVNALYILRNAGKNQDGRPRMYLTKAASQAASGFGTTPNSYFIDAGRVLTLNYTDINGVNQDNNAGADGPGFLDTNDANVFCIVNPATGGVSTGTSPGALLYLDLVDRTDGGECVVSDGIFSNTGYPAVGGCYCVYSERSNRVVIRNCTGVGVSHHGFGHSGSSDQTGCEVENCAVGDFFGAAATGNFHIAIAGRNVTRGKISRCTFNSGPVLNPRGNALPEAAVLPNGICSIAGDSTTNPIRDQLIEDCVFKPAFALGQNSTNGSLTVSKTTAVTGDPWNPEAYPTRFVRSVIGPVEISGYGTSGTNDYANTSMRDGVFLLTGGGGRTSTMSNLVHFPFNGGAWGVSVPDPLPRTIFLSKMIVLIDAGDPQGFSNTILFNMTTNNSAMCLRADSCLFLNIGRPVRGQTLYWFDYVNAAGNCGFNIRNSILANLYPTNTVGTVVGSRVLFRSDSALASASTRRVMSGNHYVGFTSYSGDTSYDTQAEYLAGIDTTGTFATGLAITGTTFETRLRTLLGRGFMGGADPMAVLRQSFVGGPVSAASSSGSSRIGRSGR